MGAPKQKWTSKEEAALKAGIAKYGAGKWSMILKDLEFGPILHLRSNVDLKDKWRNLNVAANGFGSRHRVKLALKNTPKTVKREGMVISTVAESDPEVVAVTPLAVLGETSEDSETDCTKEPMPRLDNLILDVIAKMKEPCGSSRAAIAMCIEEKYIAPPNLERLLAATLKLLTETSKLIKVKHHYRIAPLTSAFVLKTDLPKSVLKGNQKNSQILENNLPIVKNKSIDSLSKSQIDAELAKMKSMTAREAAAAAARFVAEAEAAIAAAEEAAREAEQAEAHAEETKLFAEAAEAAREALKCRTVCT